MNTNKLKLALILICAVLIVPATTEASDAVKLNDHTALFTIDFTFSDELFENEVPIAAVHGVSYLDRVNTVGYILLGNDPEIQEISTINAIILSTNEIQGTNYLVPKGTDTTFQLFILATFTESISDTYQAKITKLPYYLNGHRTSVHQNQLDELDMSILN